MRSFAVVGLLCCAPVLMGPSCGKDVEPRGRGEPCTRDEDCRSELRCLGGTCDPVELDGGGADGSRADQGMLDSGADGSGSDASGSDDSSTAAGDAAGRADAGDAS